MPRSPQTKEEQRRDEALKRALSMPPRPNKAKPKPVPKKRKAESR